MYGDKLFFEIPSLSDDQYRRWAELLEHRLGVIVPKERKLFLQSKIWSRMRELGYVDYDEYWKFVNSGIEGNLEWSQLVDRLTVHETSFFRHQPSFDLVAEDLGEKFVSQQKPFRYKVWSVSCATGEEPYSLAMMLHTLCRQAEGDVNYGITATDVSSPAVAIAKQGVYSSDKLINIEASYHSHISKLNDEMFVIKEYIKRRLAFGVFNLLDVNKPSNIKYDVIYCQNVLMYFDRSVRQRILNGLVNYLNTRGLLILGQTEINAWAHQKMTRVDRSRTLAFRLK